LLQPTALLSYGQLAFSPGRSHQLVTLSRKAKSLRSRRFFTPFRM